MKCLQQSWNILKRVAALNCKRSCILATAKSASKMFLKYYFEWRFLTTNLLHFFGEEMQLLYNQA